MKHLHYYYTMSGVSSESDPHKKIFGRTESSGQVFAIDRFRRVNLIHKYIIHCKVVVWSGLIALEWQYLLAKDPKMGRPTYLSQGHSLDDSTLRATIKRTEEMQFVERMCCKIRALSLTRRTR